MKPERQEDSKRMERRERPSWGDSSHWEGRKQKHSRRGFRRFFSFLIFFGIMVLLVAGGMTIFTLLLTRRAGGTPETAVLVWISGCGLALALPLLAVTLAFRTFRRVANPLAAVMDAADAVAEGDLTVRVPEFSGSNDFTRLAHSFNNMTEELEKADQLRRNLTADVAHELRTPLHIIQGNLEGVLDGVYEPSSEHLEATLDETRLLARLVADLHTLSLADAGQLPLNLEPVNVADLLADVATSFSGQAEAQGVVLGVETAVLPPQTQIQGDAGRLDQVLSNLVVNALRHTPAGSRIILSAKLVNDGESHAVQIIVTDGGEGIPEADLPFVFERFWRGDRARTHSAGTGGGLGLAIAKQIVVAHNGRITVTSIPQEATTFILTLPVQGKLNQSSK